MKNKLFVDGQIISNPKFEVRTEFEYLHKALKATSVFIGETTSHLIIANNSIYLCWGSPDEEKLKRRGHEFISVPKENYGFKDLASEVSILIKKLDLSNLASEDTYSRYAEECYLGFRITSDIIDDEGFSYSEYYQAFAKVVPSWITLEK